MRKRFFAAVLLLAMLLSLTADEAFDTVDECLAELVNSFAVLGGAAAQIPVDEALARCHVEIS